MMRNRLTNVTEPQIVLATFDWLLAQNILPYRFSISGGTREEREALKADILNRYARASKRLKEPLVPDFSQGGPDIEAHSLPGSEYLKVECKGTGEGRSQTQRNHFDRALSSVISFFADETEEPELENKHLCLGLALPDTQIYLHELKRRVRKSLRQKLNLWVLLYETDTGQILPIPPDDEIQ